MELLTYFNKLSFEVAWIALIMAALGSAVGRFFMFMNGNNFYNIPWNSLGQLEVCFAFTGVLLHVSCELLGVNSWYVKHSAASYLLNTANLDTPFSLFHMF